MTTNDICYFVLSNTLSADWPTHLTLQETQGMGKLIIHLKSRAYVVLPHVTKSCLTLQPEGLITTMLCVCENMKWTNLGIELPFEGDYFYLHNFIIVLVTKTIRKFESYFLSIESKQIGRNYVQITLIF